MEPNKSLLSKNSELSREPNIKNDETTSLNRGIDNMEEYRFVDEEDLPYIEEADTVILKEFGNISRREKEEETEEQRDEVNTQAVKRKNGKKMLMYSMANTVLTRSQKEKVHNYLDEYNCIPPPFFIILISIIQILVFLVYCVGAKENVTVYCAGCWVNGSVGPLLFAPTLRYEAWRFFTYQFIHQGLFHLLPNVFVQLLVGVPLELVHKCWRIAPIYMLAVVMGALLQYTLDPSVYLVGCSAGVYALIFAHLANVVLNWNEMPYRIVRVVAIGIYVSLDIGVTIWRRVQSDECDRISYSAHIAGALTGILMGIVLLYNVRVLRWETIMVIVSVTIYAALLLFSIAMTIFIKPFSVPIWQSHHCSERPDL